MADQIQLRRDSAANWTSTNPVLAQGELGIELDTYLFKIGDGVTAWASLAYANVGGGSGGVQGPKGDKGDPGTPGQIRFVGNGAPGTLIGAQPGDQYLDRDTGDIYSLT